MACRSRGADPGLFVAGEPVAQPGNHVLAVGVQRGVDAGDVVVGDLGLAEDLVDGGGDLRVLGAGHLDEHVSRGAARVGAGLDCLVAMLGRVHEPDDLAEVAGGLAGDVVRDDAAGDVDSLVRVRCDRRARDTDNR